MEVFGKKVVLKKLAKFTRKHLYQSLFFNKGSVLRPANLFKKRLWHRCFLVNFTKFLRTPFFIEHRRWLLLLIVAICTVLFQKLYMVFRKKEPLSQGICNFFFKMLQMRFSRFSKCLKAT